MSNEYDFLDELDNLEKKFFVNKFFELQSKIDSCDSVMHEMLSLLKRNDHRIRGSGIYWNEVLALYNHYIRMLEEMRRVILENIEEKPIKVKT